MDKKMFRSIAALLILAALLALAVTQIHVLGFLLKILATVLLPAFIGLLIALILDRPFNWFRKKYLILFRKSPRKHRISKGLAVASTYVSVFAFIAIFLAIVAPQIIYSIKELISNTDVYAEKVETAINSFIADSEALKGKIAPVELSGLDDWFGALFQKIADMAKHRLPEVVELATEIVTAVASAVIGLIISLYVMLNRHHLKWQAKKLVYAVFPEKISGFIRKTAKLGAKAISNYISGRILDSVIVGTLCFIGMLLLGMEYAALISFIIGVSNFIPMIGPFLGIVPSALLLLLVSPVQCFWFLVFICILMFLDSNLIDLRISGEATGLPTLFVLIAITVGGSLFGFVGFLLSVPVSAVIYQLVKDAVVAISRKKDIPLDDEPFRDPPKPARIQRKKNGSSGDGQ